MARPVRCPSCGLTQIAKETCKKCGKPLGVTTVPVLQTVTPAPPAVQAPPPVPPVENPSPVNPYSPPAVSHQGAQTPGAGAFDLDKYLLRQKVLTVHEKYEVWDEQGQPVLYVERPGRHMRNMGAMLGAIAAGLLVGGGLIWVTILLDTPALAAPALVLAIFTIFAVGVALSAKRHLYFYRDESKHWV